MVDILGRRVFSNFKVQCAHRFGRVSLSSSGPKKMSSKRKQKQAESTAYFSTLRMEALCSSKSFGNPLATRPYSLEDRILRGAMKSTTHVSVRR
jgi:hypothetical protein